MSTIRLRIHREALFMDSGLSVSDFPVHVNNRQDEPITVDDLEGLCFKKSIAKMFLRVFLESS